MNNTTHNKGGILKDSKYLIPVITIILTLAVTLIITVLTKSIMSSGQQSNVSIADNSAEESFYNKNYENAISEYEKLQEKDTWPIYTVKIAEIYSMKGEYIKSNEMLRNAYDKRNKIVDSNKDNYTKESDVELLSGIVFDYLMNNENKKAMEYGELFMTEYPNDKTIQKAILAAYIANKEKDKAKEIVNSYEIDSQSSEDLVTAAKMNFAIENFDNGLKLLENAWNVDNSNINIFNAIDEVSDNSESNILSRISKLEEKDSKQPVYKMWKAEIYLKNNKTLDKAEKLIDELDSEESENIQFKLLKAKLYEKSGKNEESNNILNDIINDNKNSFIGYYAEVLKYYNDENYSKAFESCKKLIISDREYMSSYVDLVPQILYKLGKPENAEPYFLKALITEPFNSISIFKIASHYKSYTDTNNAIYYYNLALKLDEHNPDIYYNMALINIKNQREDEAIKLLKTSIKLNDNKAEYYRTLANVYLKQKKNESALDNIRKAYAVNNTDALTLNNAGYYYITADNNIDRAFTNFKAAYDAINDGLTEEQKDIITDNYNLVKSIKNDKTKINQASELKLFD